MKLWLLKPRDKYLMYETINDESHPWTTWYDKTFGFVIRAETEHQARQIASSESDEYADGNVWLNSEYVSCTELTPDGDVGIILQDFRSA